MTTATNAVNEVYNVAVGERMTLNELYAKLRFLLEPGWPNIAEAKPIHREFRVGTLFIVRPI